MFKHTLIKTAVMTAALAFSPVAVMAQSQSGGSSAGQQSSSGASQSRSGSQSDSSSSSRISQGPFNEQKFVQKAMIGNQFEIQLAQLAQQKAESQEVKQLAQMILQDHQQANQMLMQAAGGQSGASAGAGQSGQSGQSSQSSPSSSSGGQQLDAVHQAMLAEFQQLQGAEFDQAYVVGQLGDHVKSVVKYRMASTKAQNPQIKQYATQTLPKLQGHLQHIQQLAGWDEASTASGSIQGDRSSSPRSGVDSQSGSSGASGSSSSGASGSSSGTSGSSSGGSSGADRTGGQSR